MTDPSGIVTIGVNDVGRRLHPDYLVVVNPAGQFAPDRLAHITASQARFIFTQYSDLPVSREKTVRFTLGTHNGTDFSRADVLHYTQNSPYVATCLAIHMGAKRIGLIGVDFTDNHFFAKTGRHPLAARLGSCVLSRVMPCSDRAEQRHKIIRKRVALRRDESVSVVTVGTGPTPTGDPAHARLHHWQ
jgi:hypothetical protein